MNEFFGRLVQRAWSPAPASDIVQPRLPSRFELFDRETGESAPTDVLHLAPIGLHADQTAPHSTPDSALFARPARSTVEFATTTAQDEELPTERGAASRWQIEAQSQTHTAALNSKDTPLAAPQFTEPDPQATASRIQPATIQPALTLAPMLREVGEPARTANGQVHNRAEVVDATPPAVERPIIQVTIGRVEVRAVAAPAGSRPAPPPRQPAQSLEDYLHGRKGGAR